MCVVVHWLVEFGGGLWCLGRPTSLTTDPSRFPQPNTQTHKNTPTGEVRGHGQLLPHHPQGRGAVRALQGYVPACVWVLTFGGGWGECVWLRACLRLGLGSAVYVRRPNLPFTHPTEPLHRVGAAYVRGGAALRHRAALVRDAEGLHVRDSAFLISVFVAWPFWCWPFLGLIFSYSLGTYLFFFFTYNSTNANSRIKSGMLD